MKISISFNLPLKKERKIEPKGITKLKAKFIIIAKMLIKMFQTKLMK